LILSDTTICDLQTPHVPIFGNQISVGSDKNSDIWLDDQTVSQELCILRRLEVLYASPLLECSYFVVLFVFLHKLGLFFFIFQQGGPCKLEVTGKNGKVAVNGRKFRSGFKFPLIGGDEIVFGQCGKHAYVSINYQILFIHHTCPFHSSVHSLFIWILIGTFSMIQ